MSPGGQLRAPTHADIIEFYNFLLQRKNKKQSCVWLFYYCNFERDYDVLRSKSLGILLNKNINFIKSEGESKMTNSTHSFRETKKQPPGVFCRKRCS